MEACGFEGVRVILSYRGEPYTPAYIQGISGAAFRIAGICPCAPTCSFAMEPKDLIKLLGYEFECLSHGENVDLKKSGYEMISRVKDEIRADRPALLWNAFTFAEWNVVCGFDEENKRLFGRGSYKGLDGYAEEDEMRTIDFVPHNIKEGGRGYSTILIGRKRDAFDARKAEMAALKEAVTHAHSKKVAITTTNPWTVLEGPKSYEGDKWVFLEGLQCYSRWVGDFSKPEKKRELGDSYCLSVYRSTHRAASQFMLELAPKYPEAAGYFRAAASQFAKEAGMLDQCVPLIGEDPLTGWRSPEGPDPERNARATILLDRARESYARSIGEIEKALDVIR
jgi:hypothetical protein